MTQMVEYELAQILEKIDQRMDRIEQKVDKVIESQARLEGKVETLEVKLEEKTKALQSGQDATNNKLNVQNTWQLSLITGLVLGLLALIGTIGKVVFFPNP